MGRWDGIYEFVQVVEAGSFTAAAERMGLSNSQVSKLVARLEDRLGVRLLNRTTRRLTLTDEGEHFFHRCRRTIEDFERTEQEISSHQNEPRGNLKVNIAGSFQERFIVPILVDFLKQNPGLTVDLDFTDQHVDLVSQGYDISICGGELADSSLVARKLAENYNYLVAHPDYLAKHGTPQTLDDLSHHNCLIGVDSVWQLSNGQRTEQFKPQGNWRSSNGAALLSAARGGLGIALLPYFSVLEDIGNGNLTHILQPWSKLAQPVWVIYPHHRNISAKVRLFVDYLVDHLNDNRL